MAVIQLHLRVLQSTTEFSQILFFLHRVLFDLGQHPASLLKLPVQIFQLYFQSVTLLARLLCLSGKLFKVLVRNRQYPLRPDLF